MTFGRWVPEKGTKEYWIVDENGDPGLCDECHVEGDMVYTPYYTGSKDDPQYESFVLGRQAFEAERDALVASIRLLDEEIERRTQQLAELREQKSAANARLMGVTQTKAAKPRKAKVRHVSQ